MKGADDVAGSGGIQSDDSSLCSSACAHSPKRCAGKTGHTESAPAPIVPAVPRKKVCIKSRKGFMVMLTGGQLTCPLKESQQRRLLMKGADDVAGSGGIQSDDSSLCSSACAHSPKRCTGKTEHTESAPAPIVPAVPRKKVCIKSRKGFMVMLTGGQLTCPLKESQQRRLLMKGADDVAGSGGIQSDDSSLCSSACAHSPKRCTGKTGHTESAPAPIVPAVPRKKVCIKSRKGFMVMLTGGQLTCPLKESQQRRLLMKGADDVAGSGGIQSDDSSLCSSACAHSPKRCAGKTGTHGISACADRPRRSKKESLHKEQKRVHGDVDGRPADVPTERIPAEAVFL
ncbi:hypothetical protein MTO96_042175 [Rhipicephalus appendiculatus]